MTFGVTRQQLCEFLVFEVVRLNNCTARPKHRINSKFAHLVNENDKVMTENFAESFVDHRNVGLASQRVSELAFHHRKRGFNVRAFTVVGAGPRVSFFH